MSSSLVAAYKFALQTSGGSTAALNHPPSFYAQSQTPVTVVASSVIYNPTELADTKVVGTPEVLDFQTITAGTTRRSNTMFVYDSTDVSVIAGKIRTYVDFRHFIDGSQSNDHQFRLYIYNEVTTAWVQIDSDFNNGIRTMQGEIITDLADFIDGSGNINVLCWDFEGTRNRGAGCVIEGTLVHTPQGKRAVENIKIKDEIHCLVDGERVVRHVADITKHYAADSDLVEIQAGLESVTLTADHPFPTETGIRRGTSLKNGDKIIGINGFVEVNLVRPYREFVCVFDLCPIDALGYFVGPGDGIVIHVSDAL